MKIHPRVILLLFVSLTIAGCASVSTRRMDKTAAPVNIGAVRAAYTSSTVPAVIPELKTVREWVRPTKDADWDKDVKNESLDVKHDYQLKQMSDSLKEKLPELQQRLDRFEKYPDSIRYELSQDGLSGQVLEDKFIQEYNMAVWEVKKVNQSIDRIAKEQDLRDRKVVTRTPLGTIFYIDFVNGNNANAGTSPSTAFGSLDQFMEVARSAGDMAFVRRGMASTTNVTHLTPISDGDLANPLTVAADYDNIWGEFTTSTQTYTVTFGSKTMTASAAISGIATSSWVYVYGDQWEDPNNPTTTGKLFTYEVATITENILSLKLPYKGNQSGAGNRLRNMPKNPQWNSGDGAVRLQLSGDDYWLIQGISFTGADLAGTMDFSSSYENTLIDVVATTTTAGTEALNISTAATVNVKKSRLVANGSATDAITNSSSGRGSLNVKDSLITGASECLENANFITSYFYDTEFDCGTNVIRSQTSLVSTSYLRNPKFSGTQAFITTTMPPWQGTYIEDYNNVIGDNRQLLGWIPAANPNPIISSNTETVRPNGGNTSILVTPVTANRIGKKWETSYLKVFEYPIYADTSSRTYTAYVNSTNTAHWSSDPTNDELWLECEYWGHPTNNHRKITKSTGVVDFNGATTWQSISVTCQPSQSGILYLRLMYAKPKETGADDSNAFFADIKQDIN